MKRPVRGPDGKYTIKGKKYPELFGSRIQVFNGTAYKTEGELTKSQLMMNKWGRIVSVLKYHTAKKEKRLEKAGYFAKKGKFGYVKKSAKKGSNVGRKTRKVKGGNPLNKLLAIKTTTTKYMDEVPPPVEEQGRGPNKYNSKLAKQILESNDDDDEHGPRLRRVI